MVLRPVSVFEHRHVIAELMFRKQDAAEMLVWYVDDREQVIELDAVSVAQVLATFGFHCFLRWSSLRVFRVVDQIGCQLRPLPGWLWLRSFSLLSAVMLP